MSGLNEFHGQLLFADKRAEGRYYSYAQFISWWDGIYTEWNPTRAVVQMVCTLPNKVSAGRVAAGWYVWNVETGETLTPMFSCIGDALLDWYRVHDRERRHARILHHYPNGFWHESYGETMNPMYPNSSTQIQECSGKWGAWSHGYRLGMFDTKEAARAAAEAEE